MLVLEKKNESFLQDPYPFYEQLQAKTRIYFYTADGEMDPDRWYVSHYEDVEAILKDKRFGRENNSDFQAGISTQIKPFFEELNKGSMLHRDPPDHTRLRSLVNKAFTPKRVDELRPTIETLCDELFDVMAEKEQVDFIADLAMPLPVMVISHMLGVPKEDFELIKKWSNALARILEPGASLSEGTSGFQASMEFIAYLHDIFEMRKKNPQDDLITALLEVEEQGEKLNRTELYITCILLLAAGHETTTNLIGNGLFTFHTYPDELAKLQKNPSLASCAVEEVLRYEPPVQRTARYAKEDVEIHGQTVKKGQPVVTLLAAANRDPKVFTSPEIFNIERKRNRHLSFGMGVHFCVGAPLARLEGEIAFRKLFERIPAFEVDITNPAWHPLVVFRGLKRLKGYVK